MTIAKGAYADSLTLFMVVLAATFIFSTMSLASRASAAEFGDIELSFYALGSWPRDEPIFNQGTTVPASVKSGFGGGLKVGLFPHFTKRMIGLEIDSNGHGGAISFPNTANGQNGGTGRSNLVVLNTTVNLILRYPGEAVLPYVGIGAGWSQGVLPSPDIVGRSDQDFETANAFGYQFLAGTQVMLSQKIFLFGEYRYFSTNYHWESLALDFRAHYGLAGFGLRF